MKDFDFNSDSVAHAYDNILGPAIFEPWADSLIENGGPWAGQKVLDLATGTGIVAQRLAREVGADGKVIGVDINGEMLAMARTRCNESTPPVEFIQSPASQLDISDASIDVVVCQQGFQFFPDKAAAALEIHRVLKNNGNIVATTWRPVIECRFFGSICCALVEIGQPAISDMMRIPFDFMPESELTGHFESAGFTEIELRREEKNLVLAGGLDHAVDAAYATPIGPHLRSLPSEDQHRFRERLVGNLEELSPDGITMGSMVTNAISARKTAVW